MYRVRFQFITQRFKFQEKRQLVACTGVGLSSTRCRWHNVYYLWRERGREKQNNDNYNDDRDNDDDDKGKVEEGV